MLLTVNVPTGDIENPLRDFMQYIARLQKLKMRRLAHPYLLDYDEWCADWLIL